MGRTFHLCTIAGIPLKIHWSFGLTVLFVIYVVYLHNLSIAAAVGFASLTLVMFICVILHEFGHSLAARKYGIDTVDVIISPIGGLARLKEIPEEPKKELVIALAGPAVNVVIAVLIGIYLHLVLQTEIFPPSGDFELLGYSVDFLKFVCFTNVLLVVFNMIPAFPMDGGRVLRAILSFKLERVLATRVAMWLARIISFLFVTYALQTNNITLGLIGVFVFIMSGKEYAYVKMIKKTSSRISLVQRSKFTRLSVSDSYQKVITEYKSGIEKNFLVYDNNEKIIGSIPEVFIKDALKNNNAPEFISELMSKKVAIVSPESILRKVADMMSYEGIAICAVKEGNKIIGVLDRYAIEQFMKE